MVRLILLGIVSLVIPLAGFALGPWYFLAKKKKTPGVVFAGLGLLVSLYGFYEAFQQPHGSMNTDLILVGFGISLVLIARIFHAQSMSSHTAW